MTAELSGSVIKTLFALSGNACAYHGCEVRLTDPSWRRVNADMAHIRGEKPGSARYDASMTEAKRRDFENIIVLCPNHHRLIDDLEPDKHPVDVLVEMKQLHERRSEGGWATEQELSLFVRLFLEAGGRTVLGQAKVDIGAQAAAEGRVVAVSQVVEQDEALPVTAVVGASKEPRLVVQQGPGESIEVMNVGDADAYGIALDPPIGMEGAWTPFDSVPPTIMSPGAQWRAGLLGSSLADVGPYVFRLAWRDAVGRRMAGEFPMP